MTSEEVLTHSVLPNYIYISVFPTLSWTTWDCRYLTYKRGSFISFSVIDCHRDIFPQLWVQCLKWYLVHSRCLSICWCHEWMKSSLETNHRKISRKLQMRLTWVQDLLGPGKNKRKPGVISWSGLVGTWQESWVNTLFPRVSTAFFLAVIGQLAISDCHSHRY